MKTLLTYMTYIIAVLAVTVLTANVLAEEGSAAKHKSVVAPSAQEIQPLKAGDTAPLVKVRTVEGKSIALSKAADGQAAAVIFYRGGWCPFCNRHLKALREAVPELKKLGYKTLAIAPDLPAELAKTVKKQELEYTLLSDTKMAAAKAFGVAFQVDNATLNKYKGFGIDLEAASGETHHALPVPSVFLVGKRGKIQFVYTNANYKVRLDNQALLAAAKEHASAEGSSGK